MKILKGKEQLTEPYGTPRKGGIHEGIDVVKYKNQLDYIVAIESGKVDSILTGITGYIGSGKGSYGNYIWIKHTNGFRSFYAHLSRVDVKKGQTVKKGQVIGYMGNTGKSEGAHLHFEIEKNGKLVDPTEYVFGSKTFSTVAEKPTVHELAMEVLQGKWGNGAERKKALIAKGHDYNAVQKEVNKILSKKSKLKSTNTIAKEVIAGKWGNGKDRRNRLTKAGYNYNTIQNAVNKLLS